MSVLESRDHSPFSESECCRLLPSTYCRIPHQKKGSRCLALLDQPEVGGAEPIIHPGFLLRWNSNAPQFARSVALLSVSLYHQWKSSKNNFMVGPDLIRSVFRSHFRGPRCASLTSHLRFSWTHHSHSSDSTHLTTV